MKTGSRNQFLCDQCRQCALGYHCADCQARWRQRAKRRSLQRSRDRKAAKTVSS